MTRTLRTYEFVIRASVWDERGDDDAAFLAAQREMQRLAEAGDWAKASEDVYARETEDERNGLATTA